MVLMIMIMLVLIMISDIGFLMFQKSADYFEYFNFMNNKIKK